MKHHGKTSTTIQPLQTEQNCSLQPNCVHLAVLETQIITDTCFYICTRKLNAGKKTPKQKPRMYMTIGDINIKLRSQRQFHKPNDRSNSIHGTMRVLTKDCLFNLTALLYLVEELSINLSFRENCK